MPRRPSKARRILAFTANILLPPLVLAGVFSLWLREGRLSVRMPSRATFAFFTTESNLLAGAAAVALLPSDIRAIRTGAPRRPTWVRALHFAGAEAVTVTFLTVILFLGPVAHDTPSFFRGSGFWLHLVCPLLSLCTLTVLERGERVSVPMCLAGAAPVFVYGGVYAVCVLVLRVWDDVYGFDRGGMWPLSMAVMFTGAIALAFLLRAVCNAGLSGGDLPPREELLHG